VRKIFEVEHNKKRRKPVKHSVKGLKKAPWIVFWFLRVVFRPLMWFKYGFWFDRESSKNIPKNCFILMNHQASFDQMSLGLGFRFPITFVADDTFFHKGLKSFFMKVFTRPISYSKGKPDILATRQIFSVIRQGGAVGMFPEGTRSLFGEGGRIVPSCGRLAKKLGVSLVLVKQKGGYLTKPRWKKRPNKGRIFAEIVKVISPDELQKMTDEEVQTIIEKELYHNDFEFNNIGIQISGQNKQKLNFYHGDESADLEKNVGGRNVQEALETKCHGDWLTDTKCPERVEAIPCLNQSACPRDTKWVFGCQPDTTGAATCRPKQNYKTKQNGRLMPAPTLFCCDFYRRQSVAPTVLSQIKFKGKRRAEHLETVLFYCPICHSLDSLASRKNTLSCKECDKTFIVNEYGAFDGEIGTPIAASLTQKILKKTRVSTPCRGLRPRHPEHFQQSTFSILDWSKSQLDFIKNNIDYLLYFDKPLFVDENISFFLTEKGKKIGASQKGKIELFSDKLIVCGKSFSLKNIKAFSLDDVNRLNIFLDYSAYAVETKQKTKKKINLVKYIVTVCHLNKNLKGCEIF